MTRCAPDGPQATLGGVTLPVTEALLTPELRAAVRAEFERVKAERVCGARGAAAPFFLASFSSTRHPYTDKTDRLE